MSRLLLVKRQDVFVVLPLGLHSGLGIVIDAVSRSGATVIGDALAVAESVAPLLAAPQELRSDVGNLNLDPLHGLCAGIVVVSPQSGRRLITPFHGSSPKSIAQVLNRSLIMDRIEKTTRHRLRNNRHRVAPRENVP